MMSITVLVATMTCEDLRQMISMESTREEPIAEKLKEGLIDSHLASLDALFEAQIDRQVNHTVDE